MLGLLNIAQGSDKQLRVEQDHLDPEEQGHGSWSQVHLEPEQEVGRGYILAGCTWIQGG